MSGDQILGHFKEFFSPKIESQGLEIDDTEATIAIP